MLDRSGHPSQEKRPLRNVLIPSQWKIRGAELEELKGHLINA